MLAPLARPCGGETPEGPADCFNIVTASRCQRLLIYRAGAYNADGSLDGSFVDGTIFLWCKRERLFISAGREGARRGGLRQRVLSGHFPVARLAANGGLDLTFNQGTGTPAVPAGLRHCIMGNGQILLSGGSGVYNGVMVNSGLFRLDSDGPVDQSYAGYTLGLVNVGGLIGSFFACTRWSHLFHGRIRQSWGPTVARGGAPAGRWGSGLFLCPRGADVSGTDGTASRRQTPGQPRTCFPPTSAISRLKGSGGGNSIAGPQIGTMTLRKAGLVALPVAGANGSVIVQGSSTWSIGATSAPIPLRMASCNLLTLCSARPDADF